MTDTKDVRERIKTAIAEKFAPAIDFKAPYAKAMLDMATDAALSTLSDHIAAIEAAQSPAEKLADGLRCAALATKLAGEIMDLLPASAQTGDLYKAIIVAIAPHVAARLAPPHTSSNPTPPASGN